MKLIATVHDTVALRGDLDSTSGIFLQDMRDDKRPDNLSSFDATPAL